MAQRLEKARSYCFTSFNKEEPAFKEYKYLVYGKETCPDTGKKHWQGYVSFENARSFSSVQKECKNWHLEIAKGSADSNFDYCTKEGKYKEFGTRPKPGKRNDLLDLKKKVLEGKKVDEIILEDCENYQQIRYTEKIYEYKQKQTKRNWKPEVTWIYGPSGSGKTKKAFEEAVNPWVSGNATSFFFEGYEGEEHVILDDFRGNQLKLTDLLRTLDRYEYRVSVKGSSRQFLAKKIWITSIKPPQNCYADDGEPMQQLLRRIDNVVKIGTAQRSGVILDPDSD